MVRAVLREHCGLELCRSTTPANQAGLADGRLAPELSRTGYIVTGNRPGKGYGSRRYGTLRRVVWAYELTALLASTVTSRSRVLETGAIVPRSNPRGVAHRRRTARGVKKMTGMNKDKRAKLRAELTRFAFAGPEHASQQLMDAAVDHALEAAESIEPTDAGVVWSSFANVCMAIRDAVIVGAVRIGKAAKRDLIIGAKRS